MSYNPIEYMQQKDIVDAMSSLNHSYRKAEITQLMLPDESIIGSDFDTYVKDGDGIRKESSNKVSPSDVIARNPKAIGKDLDGKDVFNEWLVPSETVRKNYGDEVISTLIEAKGFTDHMKKATVKAIPLTQELIDNITKEPGHDELRIKVSWSDEPMIAKIGDHITDQGYSISKNDMQAYVKIEDPAPKPKSPSNNGSDISSPGL